jgi:tetratricopeptide (TPR) repeat protein
MLARLRTPLWFPVLLAVLTVAVAGCAGMPSFHHAPPPPSPTAFDPSDSGAVVTFLSIASLREEGADWTGALEVTDKALAAQPNSRAALLRRAQVLLRLDESTGVTAWRDQARTILARFTDDPAPDARLTRAWLDLRDGSRDAAIAAAHAAGDDGADDARLQGLLAHVLDEAGDFQGSLDAADTAVRLDPSLEMARRERARARLALADFAGAEDDASHVLSVQHDDPESAAILAESRIRRGDHDAARHALEMIREERRDAAVRTWLAAIEIGDGHGDAARGLLEQALGQRSDDEHALALLVALDADEKRAAEAVDRLDAAVAAHPDTPALLRLRGEALRAAGRQDEADASFAKALALDPSDLASYKELLEGGGDVDARIAALGLAPGPAAVAAGMAREARGDTQGAAARYRQALEADPDLAAAQRAVAASLVEQGTDLDRALSLAQAACATRPRDPAYVDTLGLVYLRRGDHDAALKLLREAAGTSPAGTSDFAEAMHHLALAFDAKGDRAGAAEASRIALAAVGDRKPAPAWMAQARAWASRAQPAPAPDATAAGQTASEPAASSPAPAASASPSATTAAGAAATPPPANGVPAAATSAASAAPGPSTAPAAKPAPGGAPAGGRTSEALPTPSRSTSAAAAPRGATLVDAEAGAAASGQGSASPQAQSATAPPASEPSKP